MSDLISRQAAIDMIEKYFDGLPIAVHHDMLAMIHRLPSAEPDLSGFSDKLWQAAYERGKAEARERGRWIEDGYNHYKAVCSECGEPCASYVMGKPRDHFCKWCGADMRGDDAK